MGTVQTQARMSLDGTVAKPDSTAEYVAAVRWSESAEDGFGVAAAPAPCASGVYVNVLSDDGAAGVCRACPAKLARPPRLDAVGPDNGSHVNRNIASSQSGVTR